MGSCYRCCGMVINFLRLGEKEPKTGLEKYGKAYYLREPCVWTLIHLSGVFVGYSGVALLTLSLMSEEWVVTSHFRGGLISHCIENITVGTYDFTQPCTEAHFPKWQNSAICLILFACFFIFIGALLSTVGLVTISLPEKLYFYHSTAECFFAGALALQLGYFVWIFNGGPNKFDITGLGFVFGVGGIPLFFLSSVLMGLDDIMRSCRTSILYTDEMATIYASTGHKPAVKAAAKAFASAGASAVSAKQNKDVSMGPGASKGSEMATGTTTTITTTTTTTATTTTATTSTTAATATTTLAPTSEAAAGDFYLFGGGTGDHPSMMPYAPPDR